MSMTESEAINMIRDDLLFHPKDLSAKYKSALKMAMEALYEIQEYRAIGTVSEFR